MRALTISSPVGFTGLRREERPAPEPGPGQVTIDVGHAGVQGIAPGQVVAAITLGGGFAEVAITRAEHVAAVPEDSTRRRPPPCPSTP